MRTCSGYGNGWKEDSLEPAWGYRVAERGFYPSRNPVTPIRDPIQLGLSSAGSVLGWIRLQLEALPMPVAVAAASSAVA